MKLASRSPFDLLNAAKDTVKLVADRAADLDDGDGDHGTQEKSQSWDHTYQVSVP
jgi:hypothetical protein